MTAPENAPSPGTEPDDRTGCDDTNGNAYLVELYERTREIVFQNDDGKRVCSYSFGAFASVDGALALDAGRGIVIDATTVAALQQWANLDAFGLRERIRQECPVVALPGLDPFTAAHVANAPSDVEGRRR